MTSVMDAERDGYSMINFEETELRLGLPGGGGGSGNNEGGESALRSSFNTGKRGFSETATVDLKLNLSSSNNDLDSSCSGSGSGSGSGSPSSVAADKAKEITTAAPTTTTTSAPPPPRANDPSKPPAKAQVVGWPPVRSFRKNIVNTVQQRSNNDEGAEKGKAPSNAKSAAPGAGAGAFVKVSMDGAPYLRKVDLKLYKSYQELSDALSKMFISSFTTVAKCGPHAQGTKDFMNVESSSKLIDLLNGSDYVPTYEDKDGDWMLVGDVPWEMFVESCKRLRIMKGSEAIGLAPRAVEKCKNRN